MRFYRIRYKLRTGGATVSADKSPQILIIVPRYAGVSLRPTYPQTI